jgi:hypothetical protein
VLVAQVCTNFALLPSARARRVSPTDMFKGGFTTLPESLQTLWREMATFYLKIVGVAKDAGQAPAQALDAPHEDGAAPA